MQLPKNVVICEVGLRDGLQGESTQLSTTQKLGILEQVLNAGLPIVELGSLVHPKLVPQMADTETLYKLAPKDTPTEYRVLVLNLKGLERAKSAGISKVKLTVSASAAHQQRNANATIAEVLQQLETFGAYAATNGIEMSGAISTAFGCPIEGDIPYGRVALIADGFQRVGVKEISLSDTAGLANPVQMYEVCSRALDEYPDVLWNLHLHDTRGMGLANILAAMQAGMYRFDASLGGLGGCPFIPNASGNIATEDLVYMLREMGVETGIDLETLLGAAREMQSLIGRQLPSALLKTGVAPSRKGGTTADEPGTDA